MGKSYSGVRVGWGWGEHRYRKYSPEKVTPVLCFDQKVSPVKVRKEIFYMHKWEGKEVEDSPWVILPSSMADRGSESRPGG